MKEHDPSAFIESAIRAPLSLSPDSRPQENPPSLAIIAGVATGAIAYLAAPDALGTPREGNLDEVAAAAVAAFTYFASRLVAPHLCSTRKEQQHVEKWNITKGGALGTAGGIPIAIKVGTDLVTTGGLLTLMAVIGAGGIWVYNKLNRIKYCKHCQHRDSCNHVVCRNPRCLKLHFPMDKALRCDESISLTWYALASQLHNDGLNYFEALSLVKKHFHEWVPHLDGRREASTIECRSFAAWRDANMLVIASFRGTVLSADKVDMEVLERLEAELNGGRA